MASSRVLILQLPQPITVGLGPWLGDEFHVERVDVDTTSPITLVGTFDPAVIVIELRRDCVAPLLLGKQLKQLRPTTPVVLVAVDPAEDQLFDAFQIDVDGLVVDPNGPEQVAECVRRVRDGQLALDQRVLRRVARTAAGKLRALQRLSQVLTARELEIVALVGSGSTVVEIASRLFVAEGTVKVHLHNVFSKLQVRTRAQLAQYARDHGLV